jgi:hypothetical protein
VRAPSDAVGTKLYEGKSKSKKTKKGIRFNDVVDIRTFDVEEEEADVDYSIDVSTDFPGGEIEHYQDDGSLVKYPPVVGTFDFQTVDNSFR